MPSSAIVALAASIAALPAQLMQLRAGHAEASLAMEGLARQSLLQAHALGVKRILVAASKLDSLDSTFDQNRFEEVRNMALAVLHRVGVASKAITVLPVAGYTGDNVVASSHNMPWCELIH